MSGHSKWSTIKRKKGAEDAKRGKIFTRLARDIMMAAREGGGDENANNKLKLAIAKAKAANMPKDNIERAIKKSEGGDADSYEQIRYEGYGPGGVAVIVEALTDNRNRTASAVRAIFTKNGGNLGETGVVSFMFNRVGEIVYPASVGDAEKVLEAAIEAGADDVSSDEDSHTIICSFENIGEVAGALESILGESESVNIVWKPQNTVAVDEEKAQTLMKLMGALDDDEDVQNAFANFEVSDEIMAKLTAA